MLDTPRRAVGRGAAPKHSSRRDTPGVARRLPCLLKTRASEVCQALTKPQADKLPALVLAMAACGGRKTAKSLSMVLDPEWARSSLNDYFTYVVAAQSTRVLVKSTGSGWRGKRVVLREYASGRLRYQGSNVVLPAKRADGRQRRFRVVEAVLRNRLRRDLMRSIISERHPQGVSRDAWPAAVQRAVARLERASCGERVRIPATCDYGLREAPATRRGMRAAGR